MIARIADWAAAKPMAILVALALLLACIIWFMSGRLDDARRGQAEAEAQANITTSARQADNNLTGRAIGRKADATAARKEFDHATDGLSDEGLTRRQRIDLCIELRDAGANTSAIAECGDLHSGATSGP